jgi:ParB family chromosome partitioning protein
MSIVAAVPDISREITEPSPGIGYDGELMTMPLSWIVTSPLNPRKTFQEGYIVDLALSMKEVGQLQPIVVRRRMKENTSTPTYEYEIIMGECRFRAAKIAGFSTIKAVVRHIVSDREHLEMALVENLHRRDIDPIEEANGYQQLAAMGYKQAEICAKVNRSQAAVSNAMRLLKLPTEVTDLVAKGDLSVAHALAIVKYSEWPPVALEIARYVIKNKTSSHDLEKGDLWNMWHALEEKKLAVRVYHRETWQKPCRACPFNAYRGDQSDSRGSGRCFKPEHYAELQEADRAAAEAKIAKETEALRKRAESNKRLSEKLATGSPGGVSVRTDDNTKALHLKELGYDRYERISREDVEGCTDACPCRTVALDTSNAPCRICIDPGHRRALKGQATRAARIRIRKENQERIEAWLKTPGALIPMSAQSHRVLAIVAWSFIKSVSSAARRATAKLLPEGKMQGLLCADTYSVKDLDAYKVLDAEAADVILAILGSLDIQREADNCVESASGKTPIADYLLAPAPVASVPDVPCVPSPQDDPGSPKYLDCPSCVGLMTLKRQPEGTQRYECGCGHVQAVEGAIS